MIIDPARAWVSPYWHAQPPNATTWISVLNPGFWPAEVTVSFHTGGPDVHSTGEQTIQAQSIGIFMPELGAAGASLAGWVDVSSDVPVLPWGYLSDSGVQQGSETRIPMTFGRWEWAAEQFRRIPLP